MGEVAGYNTIFGHGAALAGPYAAVAKVVSVQPPEVEATDIDNSHMTTASSTRTFQAGWADGGEVEVECIYTTASYDAVLALFRLDKFFEVKYSDNSNDRFAGYVKKIGKAVEMDGLVTFKFTVKVSGPVTYDDGVV